MALPPEPFDAGLDEAVLADLEGEAAYRRYAAWLRERNDPRGDLILEQLDRTGTTTWMNHAARFAGRRPEPQSLEWHAGFLRHAAFVIRTSAQATQLAGFLSLRSARFLRSLEIESHVRKGVGVDFTASPALPLQKLALRNRAGAETLESLGRAGFDRLEDLTLSFGDSKDERLVTAFALVLQGCPSLRHLRLVVHADAICRKLVERLSSSPLLARLRSLSVTRLADGAEAVIVGRAEAFSHLETMTIEASLPVRFRVAKALPGVGRLREDLPASAIGEAQGSAPVTSPVGGGVPLAGCDGCGSEDVALLSFTQEPVPLYANNDRTPTEWSVHCRRCNKITTWSGMFA